VSTCREAVGPRPAGAESPPPSGAVEKSNCYA